MFSRKRRILDSDRIAILTSITELNVYLSSNMVDQFGFQTLEEATVSLLNQATSAESDKSRSSQSNTSDSLKLTAKLNYTQGVKEYLNLTYLCCFTDPLKEDVV